MKGLQPDAGHAETREVGQPCGQSLEVADAVAAGVHELLHVQAIDNRVAVPEVLDGHVRRGSKVCAELDGGKSCGAAAQPYRNCEPLFQLRP